MQHNTRQKRDIFGPLDLSSPKMKNEKFVKEEKEPSYVDNVNMVSRLRLREFIYKWRHFLRGEQFLERKFWVSRSGVRKQMCPYTRFEKLLSR
jgi:hypothetical protein